jgi:glutamine---fructose-6-phosphate transaminase (isomerizing)
MCGIFGYIGKKETAPEIVLSGLKSLEYRGYDSWGIAAVPLFPTDKKNPLFIEKQTGKIGLATASKFPKSTLVFGHTRWATHGGVTQANAHPHVDCSGNIAIIHNGIVENYEELKRGLIQKGHHFVSETDSEVIVHLIEEEVKQHAFTKAVQVSFNKLDGLNAIIAIDAKERYMVAARNGSPMVVGFGENENYIASDASAIVPYTKQVYFLEDNEMAIIGDRGIAIFNAKTGANVHPEKQTLDWTNEQVEKGKYDYFMLKEIHEQPGILTDIATDTTTHVATIAKKMKASYGSYLVGCGSAAYACIAGSYLFSTIAKYHINWAYGSEFGYAQDFLTKKSLIIALSQSGETMDTMDAVKRAKAKGAQILALVNVLGSSLYRMADEKILLGAGPEKSVCSTKAFTSKLAHLLLLAYAMKDKQKEGQKVVLESAKAAKKVLAPASEEYIKKIAHAIAKKDDMYCIGRGLSYPAALEAAMKIKEISYIHAESFPAGELKHGVIALIEKGTPCLVFLPDDETYHATVSNAMELKARGAMIIGVSERPNEVFDYHIPVPNAGVGTIIPMVIASQLLAYYLALERGLDIDKPRNLAKSVTVK